MTREMRNVLEITRNVNLIVDLRRRISELEKENEELRNNSGGEYAKKICGLSGLCDRR